MSAAVSSSCWIAPEDRGSDCNPQAWSAQQELAVLKEESRVTAR